MCSNNTSDVAMWINLTLPSCFCFSPVCGHLSSVALPLTIIGGIAGKNTTGDMDVPVRTARVMREIPTAPWYRNGPFLTFAVRSQHYTMICFEHNDTALGSNTSGTRSGVGVEIDICSGIFTTQTQHIDT